MFPVGDHNVTFSVSSLNSNKKTVCDPVMGDDDRLYCKPELPPAYTADIVPLASILTPNQFEAQLLTGLRIDTLQDAIQVCNALHARGPHTVVISSLHLPGKHEFVTVLASTTVEQQQEGVIRSTDTKEVERANSTTSSTKSTVYMLQVPRLHAYFTGTGDLFSALLLGYLYKHPHNLKLALENTIAALQTVLRDTAQHAAASNDVGNSSKSDEKTGSDWDSRSAAVCRARELRLIQNQDAFVQPDVQWTAVEVAPTPLQDVSDTGKQAL